MQQKLASDVVELVIRAKKDRKNAPVASPKAEKERRHIYGGTDPQSTTPGYAIRPPAKKAAAGPRRSTFNLLLVLFVAAVAIVIYIGNILAVNQLAIEVHALQIQFDKISNANNILQAEINRKTSWERIGSIASDRIGLKYSKEPASTFDINADKFEEFKNK